MNRPPLIFRGLRFPRSLSQAFPCERAGCIEIYTRPGIFARIVRALLRK